MSAKRFENLRLPRGIVILSKEGWQSLVECTGLENRHTLTGIVGSNPTPSA